MIGEQIQVNNDGTLTISCKVPAVWMPLLNLIAQAKGCINGDGSANMNALLKMCLQFLIETAKVTTDASPDMKVLLAMMRVDANWQTMFNWLTNARLDIAQVILILQQSEKGKPREGFSLAMFDKPFLGDCRQTLCVDDIVERVIEIAMGRSDYWDMRQIAQHFEAQSIREALIRMVDAQTIINLDDQDRAELPALGNAADNGRPIQYGRKTKAKQHRTPDSLARDQRIKFDDYDRELAEEEASRDLNAELSTGHALDDDLEKEMGFRPFGQEW